jgi:hypothetical protein
MNKLILTTSFDYKMPAASLVDLHRGGPDSAYMTKRAAVMTREIASIRPEPNTSVLHLISMGAQEAYGANRNGDGFNEKSAEFEIPFHKDHGGRPHVIKMAGGLVEFHPTFEKHAHVFKDHINKDPNIASGKIVTAAYNADMRRGELLIRVDNDKWHNELEKMANGQEVPFSMSCRVPYDICSICGNEAPSRAQYCKHARDEMGAIYKSGHQSFVINDRPCFFDISGVFRPADRIAYSLQKVASAERVVSSAELAEMSGISAPVPVLLDGGPRSFQEKLAVMQRMASMEKQIEARGRLFDNSLDLGAETEPMPEKAADQLGPCEVRSLTNALSDAKICLPVRDFFRLVLGDRYGSVAGEMDAVKAVLPGIYSRTLDNGAEEVAGDSTYDPEPGFLPPFVRQMIGGLVPEHSFEEGPVRKRVTIMIVRGRKPAPMAMKTASHSEKAAELALEYARYQLASTRASGGDDLTCGLTVRRNYLQ